jgi:hypothetical protein
MTIVQKLVSVGYHSIRQKPTMEFRGISSDSHDHCPKISQRWIPQYPTKVYYGIAWLFVGFPQYPTKVYYGIAWDFVGIPQYATKAHYGIAWVFVGFPRPLPESRSALDTTVSDKSPLWNCVAFRRIPTTIFQKLVSGGFTGIQYILH